MAELTVPQIDFSTLGNLGQVYQQAQARHTLADLGTQLSNGTIDYNQAAGKIAQTGNLAGTLQLLALGQKQKQDAAGAAAIQSAFGYGGSPQPAAPAPQQAGPLVPNDSNAIPGTVGMNQRLADLSQDFIQDNPNTSMTSGVRTPQQQAALYADRANNPNPVAPPGTSLHEQGLAVDIGGMTPQQRAQLPSYGLAQPVAGDPVHVQLAAGAQPASDGEDGSTAAVPVAASGPTREQIAALYASPNTRPLALELLKQKLSGGRFTQETDKDGNVWSINSATGQRTIALKADDKSKFGVIGEDSLGRKQYGFVDPNTGKVTPYTPNGAQAAPNALDGLQGEDLLGAIQKTDPTIASKVRAVLEGRAAYPTGRYMTSPEGSRVSQLVTQADPSFETGNATARVKARNEFSAGGVGSPAGQITAGNTALQHAGEMSDALERMKSDGGVLNAVGNSDIPYVSYLANQLHNSSVKGTSAGAPLNDFMTAKNHFSEEVTKFYAGSAGSEAERTRALANLDAAKSLPELRSAIKTETNLMQGKINALQDRWRNAMGPLVKDFPLIQPKSQEAIDRVMQRAASTDQAQQPQVKSNTTKSGISWSVE